MDTNPFKNSTIIHYGIPVNADIEMIIYDLQGNEVMRLNEGNKSVGYHNIEINLAKYMASSGILICRMIAESLHGNEHYESTVKLFYIK